MKVRGIVLAMAALALVLFAKARMARGESAGAGVDGSGRGAAGFNGEGHMMVADRGAVAGNGRRESTSRTGTRCGGTYTANG